MSLDAAAFVPEGRDPADLATDRDELERAWEAIDSLPDDRRQAVVLRLVNELSAKEIGDIMGRSEGAVRVLIHRGLYDGARPDERVSGAVEPSSAEEQDEAGRLDAAIDALLADRSLQSTSGDASLEATARILASRLPRLHPRFGFEERLVHRLRDEAGGQHLSDQDRRLGDRARIPGRRG